MVIPPPIFIVQLVPQVVLDAVTACDVDSLETAGVPAATGSRPRAIRRGLVRAEVVDDTGPPRRVEDCDRGAVRRHNC